MVIPCLCLFIALSSLFSELVGAKPLHLLTQTVLLLKHPTGVFVATQPRAFERLLVLFKGFVLRLQKSFFCLSAWRSSIIPHTGALVNTF